MCPCSGWVGVSLTACPTRMHPVGRSSSPKVTRIIIQQEREMVGGHSEQPFFSISSVWGASAHWTGEEWKTGKGGSSVEARLQSGQEQWLQVACRGQARRPGARAQCEGGPAHLPGSWWPSALPRPAVLMRWDSLGQAQQNVLSSWCFLICE